MGFIRKVLIPFFMVSTAYASSITTPNMGLVLPVPGTTSGPVWAQMLNTALTKIDQHAHAPGAGVLVSTIGLNINADLPMHGYNLLLPRSILLTNNGATLGTAADKTSVYAVNGDLYFNNSSGTPVQITSGTSVNVAGIGGITGLGGTSAAVTYSDISKTFTFTQSSGKTASISAGSYSLFENIVGANPVTIKSPSALGSSYNFILPAALPLTTKLLSIDNSGQVGTSVDVDGTSLEQSGVTLQIKNLGVTTAKINDNAVTTAKILDANVTLAKMAAPIGTVTTITSNGTYTVPANVRLVNIIAAGGGGGGGGADVSPGSGGAGGAVTSSILSVNPGDVLTITIGSGGGGGGARGTAGGSTSVSGIGVGILASGGQGGYYPAVGVVPASAGGGTGGDAGQPGGSGLIGSPGGFAIGGQGGGGGASIGQGGWAQGLGTSPTLGGGGGGGTPGVLGGAGAAGASGAVRIIVLN